MSDQLESFLSETERNLKSALGKKRGGAVFLEIRSHLDLAVAELVAQGVTQAEAVANALRSLGPVRPSDYTQLDGAPTWLGRKRRVKLAFFGFMSFAILGVWIVYGAPQSVAWTLPLLMAVSLSFFALVGAYGARLVVLPILAAAVLYVPLNALLMSSAWVNSGSAYGPYPRLKFKVAQDMASRAKIWAANARRLEEGRAKAAAILAFYRKNPSGPAGLPLGGQNREGIYAYPMYGRSWLAPGTRDFKFATRQWLRHGDDLLHNLDDQAAFLHARIASVQSSQAEPWSETLAGMAKLNALVAPWILVWCVLCALFGDLVCSCVRLVGRLVKSRSTAS